MVFKRGVEAWNGDDLDAFIDLVDPGIEWFALMEVMAGHAGVRRAWESFKVTVCNSRFDLTTFVTWGSVLALGEMETTGQTTGLDFTTEIAQLVTYRGGKAVRTRDFPSHAEALEAAGLPE